jgi:hypothetical protein
VLRLRGDGGRGDGCGGPGWRRVREGCDGKEGREDDGGPDRGGGVTVDKLRGEGKAEAGRGWRLVGEGLAEGVML